MNPSINSSINLSINSSTNQSIHQSFQIAPSIKSIHESIPINPSINYHQLIVTLCPCSIPLPYPCGLTHFSLVLRFALDISDWEINLTNPDVRGFHRTKALSTVFFLIVKIQNLSRTWSRIYLFLGVKLPITTCSWMIICYQ